MVNAPLAVLVAAFCALVLAVVLYAPDPYNSERRNTGTVEAAFLGAQSIEHVLSRSAAGPIDSPCQISELGSSTWKASYIVQCTASVRENVVVKALGTALPARWMAWLYARESGALLALNSLCPRLVPCVLSDDPGNRALAMTFVAPAEQLWVCALDSSLHHACGGEGASSVSRGSTFEEVGRDLGMLHTASLCGSNDAARKYAAAVPDDVPPAFQEDRDRAQDSVSRALALCSRVTGCTPTEQLENELLAVVERVSAADWRGIAHGDVCPDNVFVVQQQRGDDGSVQHRAVFVDLDKAGERHVLYDVATVLLGFMQCWARIGVSGREAAVFKAAYESTVRDECGSAFLSGFEEQLQHLLAYVLLLELSDAEMAAEGTCGERSTLSCRGRVMLTLRSFEREMNGVEHVFLPRTVEMAKSIMDSFTAIWEVDEVL